MYSMQSTYLFYLFIFEYGQNETLFAPLLAQNH